MKTYKIHLIRHGETDANILGTYSGQRTDLPLSPEGVNELRILKENTDYPQAGRVYTSPMLRCRQTGAILYPGKELHPIENLTEYDFGEFEGKTAAQLEGLPAFLQWASGAVGAPPGGEDNQDFIKRVCVGLNEIVLDMMESGVTESAVMMHGGAMMMLLAATALPRHSPVEWAAEHGRGYTVLVTPSLYHRSGVVEVTGVI